MLIFHAVWDLFAFLKKNICYSGFYKIKYEQIHNHRVRDGQAHADGSSGRCLSLGKILEIRMLM